MTSAAFPLAFNAAFRAAASPSAADVAFSQPAQAVQARATALGVRLSDTRLAWLDTTILRPLDAAGVLAASDRIFFPGRMPTDLAARINFANPGVGDLVPTGGPVFTADVGYACDGVDDHFAMSLIVATTFAGTLWQLDSAHLWMRVTGTTSSASRQLWGQTGSSTTIGLALTNTNAFSAQVNGSASFGAAVGTAGLFLATRRSATHVRGYQNGTLTSEQAAASGAPAANRTIVAMRNGTGYVAGTTQALGFGAQLSDVQIAALQAVSDAAWAGAPPA